jgi:hypothetical protein
MNTPGETVEETERGGQKKAGKPIATLWRLFGFPAKAR